MLLVCPDCSHRYRLPGDDGRTLRFACRTCGAAIDSRLHREEERLEEGRGWLVIHDGRAVGPYDTRTIVGLARSRAFGPRALVWRDEAEGWNVAGNTPPLGPEKSVAWWVKIDDSEVQPIVAGLGQVLAARPGHPPSIAALEKLVRVGRGGDAARTRLEDALLAGEQLTRLVDLLEDRLTLTDDRGERIDLRRRLATLYERLDDTVAAARAYDEALRESPDDIELIDGLCRTARGDWSSLVRRLESAIVHLEPADAARVRLRIARIQSDELDAPEAALTALDTVDTHVGGAEARALRVALYRRLERWPALAALYAEIAAETTGDDRLAALRALAEVLAETLEDPKAAASTWATIADEWPEDDDAVERLAALVGAHPDLDEAAATLDRVLVGRDDWAGVYALRAERIARVPEGSQRAGAMAELAALCVDRLGDAEAAYTWAARAVAERPHAGDFRRLHAELARLAERLPAWVDAVVAAVEADPALADVYVEAAASMPLSDIDRERLHRAVIRVAPGHDEAFRVLRAMWADRPRQLHQLIQTRLDAGAAPHALLVERAGIETDALDDPEAAWATWGQVLVTAPGDVDALRARLTIARRLGDDTRRLLALDALRESAIPADERATLDRAAARLTVDMGQMREGIARWWAIVDGAADPLTADQAGTTAGADEAIDTLIELCRAVGDVQGAIRAFEARAARHGAPTRADRHAVAALTAEVDRARAATLYRALVETAPGDATARQGLEATSDAPDDHFDIAVLRLGARADKGAALAELMSFAEPIAGPDAALIFAAAAIVHSGDDAALAPLVELRMWPEALPLLIDAWRDAALIHGSAALWRRVAEWAGRVERDDDARAAWTAASAAEPGHVESWRARLRLAEGAGDSAEALVALDALVDLEAESATLRGLQRRRGALLAAEGRTAESIDAWQAARCPTAPDDDAAALDALLPLLEAAGRHGALDAALADRITLAIEADDPLAGALSARRAAMAEADNRIEDAIALWEGALEQGHDPAASLDTLDALYAIEGRTEDQSRALARRIELSDGATRRALRARRARLLDGLGDIDGALAEWDIALAEAPGDTEALWAARALRVERGDWPEAIELGARLLAAVPADDARYADLLRSQARALVEPLDRPAEACAAWSAVLDHAPDDAEALDALEALYVRLADDAGLVRILERRRALAPRPTGALLRRIGDLRADALGDADGALAVFDAALALDPADAHAFARTAAILDGRGDAAGVLDRIERHVPHTDRETARDLHAEAAGRAEALGRHAAALEHVVSAARLGGQDAVFGPIAERLSARVGDWSAAVDAWEAALDDVRGTAAALPLHRRLLGWSRGPLDAPERALRHAAGLLALEPNDIEALEARAEAGDPAAVADALARLYAIDESSALRARRARRLGALYADALGDGARARHWFEQALAIEPADPQALAGLAEVLRAEENWPALRLVRLRQADLAGPDEADSRAEARAALLADAARLSARLGAPGQALDDWTEVLTVEPRHLEALRAARALHRAAGDRAAAVELGARLLERLVAEADVDDERRGLLRDQARLLDDLERRRPAIEAWRAVLAVEPDDAEALAALDRQLSAAAAPGELADVLDARLRLAPDDVPTWIRLGMARRAVGDIQRARLAFDAALERDPAHEDAFEAALALADAPAEVIDRIEAYLPQRCVDEAPRTRQTRIDLHGRALDAASAAGDARAMHHLAALIELTADDTRYGPIAQRLAEQTGDWQPAVQAWSTAIAGLGRIDALPLHRRVLRWSLARDAFDDARPHAEALLISDPDDIEALSALTRVSDARTRADALARLHPLLDDPRERADAAGAVAALHADALDDPRAAVGWYEAALADRVDDPELLARLADVHRTLGDRFALCRTRRRQAAAATGAERIALRAAAARLADELGDPHAARDWHAVLTDAPDHREALEAARRIALRRDDVESAASLGDRLLVLLDATDPARTALLRDQARLNDAERPEWAIDLWKALLAAEPGDIEALDALEALYGRIDDAHGLLYVLEQRRSGTPSPALLVRSGDIRREALGDARGALADYDAALEADPLNREAFERARAACIALGDRAGELDRIEARLERVEAPASRTRLHVRAAHLAEQLQRPRAALRHWSAAARATGEDARFAEPVERLAAEADDWATPAAAWRAALVGRPAGEAAPLRRRLLGWARGPLADDAEARVHAEHLLAIDPDDPVALHALADAAATSTERADALGRLYALAEEPARKAELARELGRLHAAEAPGRAVRWFEAALAAQPGHRQTLDALAELHRAGDAWGPLLAVRVQQAEIDADPRRLAEAAGLAEQLGRGEEAVQHWRGALDGLAADDALYAQGLLALDRLLSAQGRWAALDAVLETRIARSAGSGGGARDLWVRRARLAAERLDDPSAALAAWRAVLAEVPDDEEALWAAIELSEGADRAALRRRLVATLPTEDPRRLVLLRVLAREARPSRQTRAWEALLAEVPDDAEALDTLEAAYEEGGDWPALGRILAARIGTPPSDAGRLLRLARLRDERLGDPEAAATAYETLLNLTPDNEHAFGRLIELRIAAGRPDAALARIERRLSRERDAESRIALRLQAAELAESRLDRAPEALTHVCRAFAETLDDARFGPEAARLARTVGDWTRPVETWTAAIDGAPARLAQALNLRLAGWASGPMGDAALARHHYRAVLALEPEHREALRALAALAEHEPADRAEALEGLLAAEADAETRRGLALRLADLYAGPLADPDRAVARYQTALECGGDAGEALAGLARVYAGRAAWAALLDVRRRQIDGLTGVARAAMRIEMARLAERLGRAEAAVEHWRIGLDEGIDPHEALPALDALLTDARRWSALADVLDRRIALAGGDRASLRALHVRRAALSTERLADPAAARAHWQAILALEPRDTEALWALRALVESPAERVAVDRRLIAVLPSNEAGVLRREVARLCGQPAPLGLGRPDDAVTEWRAVLAEAPGDAEALDALESLLGRGAAEPAALIEILRMRHAASPSIGLRMRIAALLDAAGEPESALAEYRAVLDDAPDHGEAFARARRLLIAVDDTAGLSALVEARLPHVGEPAVRRALADEAARLAEGQGALDRAQHWLGEAFAICRDDAAYGDAMARMADATGDWSGAIERWQRAAEAVAGTDAAVAVELRLHAWLAGRDPQASDEALRRAAAIAPEDERVLRAQARAAEGGRDDAAMLRILIALRRQTAADSTRRDLTRRIARLLAGPIDNPDAALAEYTRLLAEWPDDGEALAQRAELLRRLDRPGDLFTVLGEMLERGVEPGVRRALLEERAVLAEREGLTDAAIETWGIILASGGDPTPAWSALETLFTANERLDDLEALFVDRAQNVDGPASAALWVRAAHTAERRQDPENARLHYEAALDADPHCDPALRVMAALHAGAGETAEQARFEARLASRLPDDTPEAVDRWRAIGRLCHGEDDPRQAIDAWRQVLRAAPGDEEALAALADLYAIVGDDAALADVLAARERTLADGGEKRALLGRVATLREQLGDPASAVQTWRRLFALDPVADEPFEALDRLLTAGEDWTTLAGILLERAAAQPPVRRAGLRLRAAELLSERAARPADALAARLAVFAEQPDDGAHGPAIAALAEAADGWQAAATAWSAALEQGLPVEQAVPLRMRLAGWQAEHLGAPEEAIAQYCAVLDRVPDHAEALARMERLRSTVGDWSVLASLLQQRVARARDESERLAALRRLGRVQARQPEAGQAAIATWRRVSRAEPGDDEAAEALARLYAQTAQWPALVRLLEERAPTPERLRRIAALCITRLDDNARAIDALQRARAIDPADPETGRALLAAYHAGGRWSALQDLYGDLVRRRPPPERPALLRGLAGMLEAHMGDARAAADAWRALLRLVPGDAHAMGELDRLERAADRRAPLADVWARHIQALPAEQAIDARLTTAALHRDLGDPYRAIDTLRPALDVPRGHGKALRLLAELYAETGDWRYCAEMLDREIQSAEPATRIARLREAADVRERHLQDPLGAFERMSAAWRLAPEDEGLAAEAARLGNRVARPRALLELCREVEGRIAAVPARGRVLRAMARLARAQGDADTERDAWRSLHDAVDPDDREALDGLARLLVADEAWSALRPILESQMALEPRPTIALALGILSAEHLDRPGEAAGWYRRALALDPRERRALAGLVDIERSRAAWPALYHALDRLAETLQGEDEAAVRIEQATLATERLGRPADARRLWEMVLELRGGHDPAALAALDRLLSTTGGDDESLVAVLEQRIDAGEPPAPLHVRLAELHGQRGRSRRALEHWRAALAAEPDCTPALWAIHQASRDASEVVVARRRLLARMATDDPRRLELLRAHARQVQADADALAAIAAWRAVRAEAALDREAVAALMGLYESAGETAALADLLAETGVDRLRAAAIYVELGRPRTARRLYERVLEAEPGHAEACAALADIHHAALRWPALAEVLSARLAVSRDPDERAALRRRLADVQHRRLRTPEDALWTLLAAFEERPDAALLPELHALAEETGAWPPLAEIGERIVDASGERADGWLHGWLCGLYAERLYMPQAAISHARRHWQRAADDAERASARVRLEALLTAAEDWDGLAGVLARHADRLPADEQRRVLGALARLHAERRGDPGAATAVWQDVLAADPADAEALEALATLHRETDRLDELCAVLERRFEQAADTDARVELAVQIADVALQLGDASRAVPPLRVVVDETRRPALFARLADLYQRSGRGSAALSVRLEALELLPTAEARGQALVALADDLREPGRTPWRGLRTAYAHDPAGWTAAETLLEAVGRWDDRVALATLDAEADGGRDRWVTVARLHGERRGDEHAALAAWQVALMTAPGDGQILDAIERIHRTHGRTERFAALLDEQIERVAPSRAVGLALRLAAVESGRMAPAATADALERALKASGAELDPGATVELLAETVTGDRSLDAIGDDSVDGMSVDGMSVDEMSDGSGVMFDAIDDSSHAMVDGGWDAIDVLDRIGLARAAAGEWSACRDAARRALRLADACRPVAERVARRLMLAALEAGLGEAGWDALYDAVAGGPLFEPVLEQLAASHPTRWRMFARKAAVEADDAASWARLARGLGDEAAVDAWRRVLDHAPADGEALARLAAHDRAAGDRSALVDRQIAAAAIDAAALDGLIEIGADPAFEPHDRHRALEAVHAADPTRAPLDALAMARLAVGDTDGWVEMLERARDAERDPAAWAARTVVLADAGRPWDALFADADVDALDALDAALAADDRWTDVAELRRFRAHDEESRRALARVAGRLGRTAEAFEAWRAVLAAAPGDAEALAAVIASEADLPAEAVAEVYRAQIPARSTADQRVELAVRLADLVERLPETVALAALAALDGALQRDDAPRLAERLAALRASRGDAAGAAELWARALEAVEASDERVSRLGELADLRSRAGDLDGAFEAAAEALRLKPEADDEDARLARLARATGREADRAALLASLTDAVGDERRAGIEAELASLYGGELADTAAAEAFWRRRLSAEPGDGEALARLIQRLQSGERWADLAALYGQRAVSMPGEAAALHTARARIFADRLHDPAAEAEAWRAVRACDPRDEQALRALWRLEARLDGDLEARDDLARALLQRIPSADPLRPVLHRWLAPRVEPREAAQHWRAVLALDPEADDAADALEALRRSAGDHDAVRALLDRKLGRVSGAEAEADVWRAIAELEQRRDAPAAARGAWREVLRRLPHDPQAEAALVDAHLAADEVEAWAALRLDGLDGVADPAARQELYREVAGVLEARLPDAGPAFEVMARAFAERAHDPGLADEVSRLAEASGRWAELGDLWRETLDDLDGAPALALTLRLAALEDRHGRSDAAAEAWRRALAIDPRSVPALEGLEQDALRRGDEAALADVLVARLRTPAGEAEALERWRRLARLRADAGEGAEAEVAWQAVLQRSPSDAEALDALASWYAADGQWRPLMEILVRQLAHADGDGVELRRRLARLCLDRLDDRAAARSALAPVADRTDDPELLGLLVELTRAEGDWPACAAALDRLARWSTGGAARDAWIAKADIQRDHLGDADGARASLRAAAEHDPRRRDVLEGLLALAEEAGDAPDAARLLTRLLPAGDAEERARWSTRLGELNADALGDMAGAVEAWTQALTAAPDHGPALRRLAEHALAERRWPDAAVLLDRLIAAEPDAEPSRLRERHLAAARCADALDDDAAARRHYEAALALDGTHRPGLMALSDLAFRQGDWARAFQVGQALLMHHGDAIESAERADRLHRLGALKALLGEPERAAAFYRQALDAWPEHGPSRRALAEVAAPEAARAASPEDPSWIGEADLLDAEDAALDAYLYGDGPAPTLRSSADEEAGDDGLVLFDSIDVEPIELDDVVTSAAATRPSALPEAIRHTAAYASPMVPPEALDVEGAVERAVEAPLERAVDRIVERIGERPLRAEVDGEGLAAVTRAAESAAAEAAAAARAAEAAAEAASAGAAAMTALPLATAAALQAPGESSAPRERSPVKPIKASKVRVLRRTSPRRRYLYVGLAAAVVLMGVTGGLFAVQSYRLSETEEDNARLTRVSESLARRVSATQLAFEKVTRELKGEELGPDMPTERAIALFDDEGQPLDEVMLELAFRDLEMREELGAVKDILASADASRDNAAERNKALEVRVAALQSHIDELKQKQVDVHERLAGRLDQNIQAIETALTATGVDFDAMVNPELGKTPIVVAGLDDAPLTGAGGPFIAEGTSEYVNPVPGETEVMSGFGPRGHSHHNGIDIPAPIGTAVLAVSAGKIIHVQDRAAWQGRPKWIERGGRRIKSHGWRAGIYVELEQDDGRISRYMHLAAVAPGIEIGARVQKGQVLGSVGRTGVEKSDTHLHFELREAPKDGERYGAALDPTAAVHKDDADVIVGTSLLHADPALIEVSDSGLEALAGRAALSGRAADDEAGKSGRPVVSQLDGRMDRLQSLEKLLREMPLVPPVDDFRVSSRFGRRLDPINGEWGFHGGLDIPGAEGSPVRATAPGKVVFSGKRGRYGVMVEIDHGNGVTTRYGHLLRSLVREGQTVRYRARIGEMGSSGRTTGTHLHYEVRVDGKSRDPMNFIQAGRYVFKR